MEPTQARARIHMSEVWPREVSVRVHPARPVRPAERAPQDRCLLHRLQRLLANQRKRTTRNLATMNAALQTYDRSRADHTGKERSPAESQASLQRALRTLRAIRLRYEIDRMQNSDASSRSVHVALGHADMCWITAAIGALEQAIDAGARAAATATIHRVGP